MCHVNSRVVVVLLMTIVICRAGLAQNETPAQIPARFSLAITVQQNAESDPPLKLEVTLRNTSPKTIDLPALKDPSHAEWDFRIMVKEASPGRILPFVEQPPILGHLSFVDLKPNESLKATCDLMKAYQLKPGTYTVQAFAYDREVWMTPFPDAKPGQPRVSDLGPAKPPANPPPPIPPGRKVESNVVEFTVAPAKESQAN